MLLPICHMLVQEPYSDHTLKEWNSATEKQGSFRDFYSTCMYAVESLSENKTNW